MSLVERNKEAPSCFGAQQEAAIRGTSMPLMHLHPRLQIQYSTPPRPCPFGQASTEAGSGGASALLTADEFLYLSHIRNLML
jgi:hypothetical protein